MWWTKLKVLSGGGEFEVQANVCFNDVIEMGGVLSGERDAQSVAMNFKMCLLLSDR